MDMLYIMCVGACRRTCCPFGPQKSTMRADSKLGIFHRTAPPPLSTNCIILPSLRTNQPINQPIMSCCVHHESIMSCCVHHEPIMSCCLHCAFSTHPHPLSNSLPKRHDRVTLTWHTLYHAEKESRKSYTSMSARSWTTRPSRTRSGTRHHHLPHTHTHHPAIPPPQPT